MHSSVCDVRRANIAASCGTNCSKRQVGNLKWVFALWLATLSFTYVDPVQAEPVQASASEKLNFYMPFHSEQFPQLFSKLEAALVDTGLGDITIRTADFWQGYQQGLKRGSKGIYYAAPHFAAWSINQHDFEPIVRLKESLKFVITSRRASSEYFEVNDLSNQKVCAQRALNLDYLLVNTGFDNPVLSAQTISVWSVLDEIDKPDTDCVAFAISDHAFIELAKDRPQEFIRLQQGARFKNYTFVAHSSLDTKQINTLRKFLLREDIQELMRPIYRLTATKVKLVDAERSDYPVRYMRPLAPYWQRKQ